MFTIRTRILIKCLPNGVYEPFIRPKLSKSFRREQQDNLISFTPFLLKKLCEIRLFKPNTNSGTMNVLTISQRSFIWIETLLRYILLRIIIMSCSLHLLIVWNEMEIRGEGSKFLKRKRTENNTSINGHVWNDDDVHRWFLYTDITHI